MRGPTVGSRLSIQRIPRFSVMIPAALLLACADPTGPREDPALQTNETEYVLTSDDRSLQGEIPFAFTNRTESMVSVVNCQGRAPPILEKRVMDGWVLAWAAVRQLCLSPPIEIAPGETYGDTLRVRAGLPSSRIQPTFAVDEVEGIYRMVWTDVVHDFDFDRQGLGDLLPPEDRISNSFILRVE